MIVSFLFVLRCSEIVYCFSPLSHLRHWIPDRSREWRGILFYDFVDADCHPEQSGQAVFPIPLSGMRFLVNQRLIRLRRNIKRKTLRALRLCEILPCGRRFPIKSGMTRGTLRGFVSVWLHLYGDRRFFAALPRRWRDRQNDAWGGLCVFMVFFFLP